MTTSPRESEILVLAPTGQDASLIAAALAREGVAARVCENVAAVIEEAKKGAGALLIADEALNPASIEALNEFLVSQAPWSDLPLIVMTSPAHSPSVSQRIYRAFSPSGSLSLLERPFRSLTLLSVVKVALRARERQYEVRELLLAQAKATSIRDEFISIASHELKTPLTALKLQSQITRRFINAADPGASIERLVKFIELANTQVDRLTRLVEDMLDVSRITSNKLHIQRSEVDLAGLLTEILDQFSAQLVDAGCEVTVKLEELPAGQWDRYRIEQVISNLLTNAIRYAPGKPIHVSLKKQGGFAVLEVKDEGPGIPGPNKNRIFERFERAVSSSNISGLGLGLYICRQILLAHGGTIDVTSEPGGGAHFSIRLPFSPPAMPPKEREARVL